MTFGTEHLMIGDAEQAALSNALASALQSNPVAMCIEEQVARVETLTSAYDFPEGMLRIWVRALVLWELYSRAGNVPANVKDAFTEAQKELEAVRDGKYDHLLKTGEAGQQSPNAAAVIERTLEYERGDQEGL